MSAKSIHPSPLGLPLAELRCGCLTAPAGYCLYGGQTILVVTLGHGVYGFTLDTTSGEFVLTHPKIKIPPRGTVYSFNEGNSQKWDPRVRDYVNNLKTGQCQAGKPYQGIYIGALVADIHNVLMKGGLYGYPGSLSKPEGKIRLLYEANPISHLVSGAVQATVGRIMGANASIKGESADS